jgi:hypothetical protein
VNPHIVVGHSLGSVVAMEALALSNGIHGCSSLPEHPWRGHGSHKHAARRQDSGCVANPADWTKLIDFSDEVTSRQIPPMSPYANAHNVAIDNDHYSTWLGRVGG